MLCRTNLINVTHNFNLQHCCKTSGTASRVLLMQHFLNCMWSSCFFFICLFSILVLDPKETTFMNGGQLYWGLQGQYMKVAFSSLTLRFHRTILLNHLRLVGGY